MPQKEADRTGTRLTVRVSNELRAAIERCAAEDRRTVAGWVVLRLEDAVIAAGESPTKKSTKRR